MYQTDTAALYASLGMKGTTYQVPYEGALAAVGDLTGMRVLDFGCGAGRSTQLIATLHPSELIGLDQNRAMLDQAQARGLDNIAFIEVGTEQAAQQLKPESFDVVFAFSVYCEFSNRKEMETVTRSVAGYLRPQGRFVMATTNPLCGGADFINFNYQNAPDIQDGDPWPCHMHTDPPFVINDTYWSLETFDDIFLSNGFEIAARFFPLAAGDGWRDEMRVAPQVVYSLIKSEA